MVKIGIILISAILCLCSLAAVEAAPQNPDLAASQLVINLPGRTLELYAGTRLVKRYPVAIGKPSTPTPTGRIFIINKEVDPAWYPPETPGRVVPSGPYNPLGYRWIGFLPTYGVHGTNNPDSIGEVVSNGCIRMYEADVEELYEMVNLNTPLRIVYERIRVGLDAQNRAYIAIYPDVYGRQPVSVQSVREKLQPHGWNAWLDDTTIRRLVNEANEKEFVFLNFYKLLLNGKLLPRTVQSDSAGLQIPVQAIGEAVKAKVFFDAEQGLIKVGSRTFPGSLKGETIYAAPESISILFGGSQTFQASTGTLTAEILMLTLNGKPVVGDFPLVAEIPLVPVVVLAEVLGQKIVWDEKTGILTAANRNVPVKTVNGKPYLPINKVYEYFKAYVYWDEAARIIDLTYPFHEPSDY